MTYYSINEEESLEEEFAAYLNETKNEGWHDGRAGLAMMISLQKLECVVYAFVSDPSWVWIHSSVPVGIGAHAPAL